MCRGIAALWVGSIFLFSVRCLAVTTTGTRDREELAIARRMHTPSTEAQHSSEVKSRALEQEKGDDGKPELHVSMAGAKEGTPPMVEDSEPGVRIEEMEENWTKQASTPAPPDAVLENARSVYSELSDEILVRRLVRFPPSLDGAMLDHYIHRTAA